MANLEKIVEERRHPEADDLGVAHLEGLSRTHQAPADIVAFARAQRDARVDFRAALRLFADTRHDGRGVATQ